MIRAIIHAIWPIEEYASNGRIWDWFIPPSPPIRALIIIEINPIMFISLGKINNRRDRGASFCQVARIIHFSQERALITWGNHWWRGAIPSFIIILTRNISWIILKNFDWIIKLLDIVPAVRRTPLPIAWIIKYFTAAWVSWNNFWFIIRGMKDNRFSSRPIHKYNQLLLERAIMDPNIIVEINNKDEGNIKTWKELNLSDKELEVPFCPASLYFHSREASFHSWYKPNRRINENIMRRSFDVKVIYCIDGIGSSRAISISNTKNNTARIKNRIENGIRAELWGSNPHSKGVLFSKFWWLYLFRKMVAIIIIVGKRLEINIKIIIFIIFLGENPYLWSKNSLLCKLLRKMLGRFPYLTTSRLSVLPAQHHFIIKHTIIIITKVRGRNCFHVRLINKSYRIRGYAPRAQIKIVLIMVVFTIIKISIVLLEIFRDINSAVLIIPITIMFIYSAIKINAKVPELYSVLNPDTNSDSPSAKSNGVRLVSARHEISQVVKSGHIISINIMEWLAVKLFRDTVFIKIKGVRIINAILTSYEMVWAILRRAPSREYFLFADHPANSVV